MNLAEARMRSQNGKKSEEELRGQISAFQTMEKALGDAQEDLNSGSSLKKERHGRNSAR